MSIPFKTVKANAIRQARREGNDMLITEDEYGYSFRKYYTGIKLIFGEKPAGMVFCRWVQGILTTTYVPFPLKDIKYGGYTMKFKNSDFLYENLILRRTPTNSTEAYNKLVCLRELEARRYPVAYDLTGRPLSKRRERIIRMYWAFRKQEDRAHV